MTQEFQANDIFFNFEIQTSNHRNCNSKFARNKQIQCHQGHRHLHQDIT